MPNDNNETTNTNQTNTNGFESPRETQPIQLEKNATPPGAPNINADGVKRVANIQPNSR
jgi:hypothetical protein